MEDVYQLIKLEHILGGLEGFPNTGRLFVLLDVLPIGTDTSRIIWWFSFHYFCKENVSNKLRNLRLNIFFFGGERHLGWEKKQKTLTGEGKWVGCLSFPSFQMRNSFNLPFLS